ncbi:MAG: diguanylate cyclase domain-containing protein [Syntrophomonadales bacterium]|jgi:diguanylate cyclase (GGDEF)-like protein/PAS domain S-box-containing protein
MENTSRIKTVKNMQIDPFHSIGDLSGIYRAVLDIALDNILILDEQGHILEANQKAIECYGYTKEELLSLRLLDIRHPSTWKDYESQMAASKQHGVFFESIHCRRDGSCLPVEVSSRSVQVDGQLLRVHIIRDITERRKNEERIYHLAHYDLLTGLENRGSILNRFDYAYSEANSRNSSMALMVIDLDKFKFINDNYGHLIGDEVLRTAAQRFRKALRKNDYIGRYGGDEFLLIQEDIADKHDIMALVQRIFIELEKPWEFDGLSLMVNLSIGIGIFPSDAGCQEDLIRCADRAMYAAKKIDGNAYAFCDQLDP